MDTYCGLRVGSIVSRLLGAREKKGETIKARSGQPPS